jgi:hypothetical protein
VRKGQELPTAEAQAKSWAGYSTDRYTVPIIGVVSRDGKYLAALANDSATSMAQAWHDAIQHVLHLLPYENKDETVAGPADPWIVVPASEVYETGEKVIKLPGIPGSR